MTFDRNSGIAGLKGALGYVRAYRDRTFVIKVGGEVLGDTEALDGVAAQVSLLSSLGIRMLLSAARVLGRRGAKFIMYGASPAVMEIIETTALSDIIPVLASEADAMAAVSG